MMTLIENLPGHVDPVLACPEGPLSEFASGIGVPVHQTHVVEGSLKLHPVHTSRGVLDTARAGRQVRKIAQEVAADVVHANSIRAGLVAAPVRPPMLVHFHDRLPPGPLSRLTLAILGRASAGILACSRYTAEQVPPGNGSPPVTVVHNPIDMSEFDPNRFDRDRARASLGVRPGDVALGLVAQITPWKGQDDAIRMMARLAPDHPDVRLVLAGSPKFTSGATRYDNLSFARELERMIDELGVRGKVLMLGERHDIPEIMSALDVLLVPSWEEPFGMALIEGMAMGLPVLATDRGGTAEILREGRDGFLLPPKDPTAWTEALEPLVASGDRRAQVGAEAREVVGRSLAAPLYAERVVEAYDAVLSESTSRSS